MRRILYGKGNSFVDQPCPHPLKKGLNFNINIIAGHETPQLLFKDLTTESEGQRMCLYAVSLSVLPIMENLQQRMLENAALWGGIVSAHGAVAGRSC